MYTTGGASTQGNLALAARSRGLRHTSHTPCSQRTCAAHTRAPGVSRALCERRGERTHAYLRQAGARGGAGGSGRGCDLAAHRADVLSGVAVEVVEEQAVADKHSRHDREHPRPGWPTAVKWAALEAAGSSTRGNGWAHSGPASSQECGAAQSRQARPEKAQEPSWGTAKRGTLTILPGQRGRSVKILGLKT